MLSKMAERDILREQLVSNFVFTKIERLDRALHIDRSRCQSFIVGDFESGNFIRFRPIGSDVRQVRLAVSQVVAFVERPPALRQLELEDAYHLEGTQINLKTFVKGLQSLGRKLHFMIEAPSDISIVREELIDWPNELPRLIENPDREFRGLSLTLGCLRGMAIGYISQGSYLRLRFLASNRQYAALTLSEIVQNRESPTRTYWVRLSDRIYTLERSRIDFKFYPDKRDPRRLTVVTDAPREIPILREKFLAG